MRSLLLAFTLATSSALACSGHDYDANEGTGTWTDFVVHVREGTVSGAVVGGACKGDGSVAGCARRRASPPEAWLDGECWITVQRWDTTDLARTLENRGHEFSHCERGSWHTK